MHSSVLAQYGARKQQFAACAQYPNLFLCRITSQSKDLYRIVTDSGDCYAQVSGKFRYEAATPAQYPAVGDFCMVDRLDDHAGNAMIQQLLPRTSAFERVAAGDVAYTQVVAANIDYLFICMALNSDYNLSRLERYLSVGWSSGATPIVVLTKSDLCENLPQVLAEISAIALGATVFTTTSLEEATIEPLRELLTPGVTASFIGSSGVGKSTLVNRLAGAAVMSTSDIRAEDDKGRHTTTRRELILLPRGGLVMDTPGMRALGVETVELAQAFSDIDTLAQHCRFGDCTHATEPGCAVRQALESGQLDARRLESYQKLKKEARYDGLSSRQIEEEKIKSMFGGVGAMKQARDAIKKKNK